MQNAGEGLYRRVQRCSSANRQNAIMASFSGISNSSADCFRQVCLSQHGNEESARSEHAKHATGHAQVEDPSYSRSDEVSMVTPSQWCHELGCQAVMDASSGPTLKSLFYRRKICPRKDSTPSCSNRQALTDYLRPFKCY